MSDTQMASICRGHRFRVAFTTFRDLCSGQAWWTRDDDGVGLRLPYSADIELHSKDLRLPKIGAVIAPGDPICGQVVNDSSLAIVITSAMEVASKQTAFSSLYKIRGWQYIRERSPKIRTAGLKVSVAPDLTKEKRFVTKEFLKRDKSCRVIIPAEGIKGSFATFKAWAETTGTPVNVTEGIVPDSVKAIYEEWFDRNVQTYNVKHCIGTHPEVLEHYLEANRQHGTSSDAEDVFDKGGFRIHQDKDGNYWVEQRVQTLFCDYIAEVECTPTSTKRTVSSLCMNQHFLLAKAGIDFWSTPRAVRDRENVARFILMLRANIDNTLIEQYDFDALLPLYSQINVDTMLKGFSAVVKAIEKNAKSEDNPNSMFRLGIEGISLVLDPQAIAMVCGKCITPSNQFGLRLLDFMMALTAPQTVTLEDGVTTVYSERYIQQLGHLRARVLGAMKYFGTNKSFAKKLTRSERSGIMLVNRGQDSIPFHEVWVNADECKEGIHLLCRFPTSQFATVKVVHHPDVPPGCVYTSPKCTVTHMGDFDGDLVLLMPLNKAQLNQDLIKAYAEVGKNIPAIA